MSNWVVSPPVALVLYLFLVGLLYGSGRLLAPPNREKDDNHSLYGSGETAALSKAAPGYRRFFVVALFFAVLHLGALVLGTVALTASGAQASPGLITGIIVYLVGLALTLLVLILG
jgi:NADH:ubiquinone oxidoreductase subunit 3 (subunit A)